MCFYHSFITYNLFIVIHCFTSIVILRLHVPNCFICINYDDYSLSDYIRAIPSFLAQVATASAMQSATPGSNTVGNI